MMTASSESGYDYGYFYVDGNQQGVQVSGTTTTSGAISLDARTHTIILEYTKDVSVSLNNDNVMATWSVS